MSRAGDEIHNPRTGQRMRFLRTAADTNGALLRIETVNPPSAVPEPVHVHPRQESRAEVISGTLRFEVDGEERRLGPGAVLTIPAGTPHHFVNDGSEDAVAIQEFRPALRTAELFAVLFHLARRGELVVGDDRWSSPASVSQAAAMCSLVASRRNDARFDRGGVTMHAARAQGVP